MFCCVFFLSHWFSFVSYTVYICLFLFSCSVSSIKYFPLRTVVFYNSKFFIITSLSVLSKENTKLIVNRINITYPAKNATLIKHNSECQYLFLFLPLVYGKYLFPCKLLLNRCVLVSSSSVCVFVCICVCILLKFHLCFRIALTNKKGHDIISSFFFCKVFLCV